MSESNFVVSSFCVRGECVEVAAPADVIVVRATGDRDVTVTFTDAEWTAFVAGVKNGEFDLETLRG
ncbi:DUF397 domain-containing protein [Pseudonocardia sp. ICBG162]|uniref:DUF397 domain-containing protein n=1 Tax=Pseudonocardia sp. ICBG162 TaxID=2846761 RepID=UPI001CF61F7D|nr:DUF397 domain-containing protein [Pseudonocardia sp. ICBG162]